MKDFFRNRNPVVPLRERSDVTIRESQANSLEIADLRCQCEKLLFRVQQLERREKILIDLVSNLRKKAVADDQHSDRIPPHPRPDRFAETSTEVSPIRTSEITPTNTQSVAEPPDFSSALQDLNNRH